MRRINRVRQRRGLRVLNWDRQLTFVARRHAMTMAERRAIWHDEDMRYEITRWRRLAQNSGRAGRCAGVFRAFMRSTPHRANILGTWRFMGVGSDRAGGNLYVQMVFESRRDPGNVYRWP